MWRGGILVVVALAAAAPAANAQDVPRIPVDTRAGGIDLSGLTVEEATARLATQLAPLAAKPVVVRAAGRRFVLSADSADVRFDAERTARRARQQGPGDVGLAIGHSDEAVRGFVANIAARVGRPARNARVRITIRRMIKRRARHGAGINQGRLVKKVSFALDHPAASHGLRTRRKRIPPAVTGRDLRRRYGTVLTIDKGRFRLRLFKNLRHSKTFGIAVGMGGYETPPGLYSIQSKQVNPPWHAPNRPWAGALAGQTIPGGAPNNPLKARWLGIAGGVGIHGTAEEWSIGTKASHGCIRMRVRDVLRLYPRVPVGSPVLIR
jgi:L,D-transpeptidase catalytic domain